MAISVILQILRRWTTIVAWIAAIVAIGVAAFTQYTIPGEILNLGPLQVAMDKPLVILGRRLIVEPVDQLPIVFIFLTAAVMFIIAWRIITSL